MAINEKHIIKTTDYDERPLYGSRAGAALMLIAPPALAGKSCDELKSEIEAKIKAKNVKTYTLDVVGKDEQKDGKVVGTCDGGTKKIIYKRG